MYPEPQDLHRAPLNWHHMQMIIRQSLAHWQHSTTGSIRYYSPHSPFSTIKPIYYLFAYASGIEQHGSHPSHYYSCELQPRCILAYTRTHCTADTGKHSTSREGVFFSDSVMPQRDIANFIINGSSAHKALYCVYINQTDYDFTCFGQDLWFRWIGRGTTRGTESNCYFIIILSSWTGKKNIFDPLVAFASFRFFLSLVDRRSETCCGRLR